MSITGAVRVIKGQEVLPDGSTLEEHGITDGSTVNIIIEPDKEISLKLKLGPKQFTQKVKSSVRVRDLKQHLIDGGTVGFSINEFQLIISADDNDGITEDVLLQDESLPLHLCGVGDNMTLRIIAGNIRIHLVTHRGEHWFKQFPKSMTIKQMKQAIKSVNYFFRIDPDDAPHDDPTLTSDITLFLQCDDDSYRKLEDEVPVGEQLSDNDIVHFIEERFFNKEEMMSVFYKDEEIGDVGWSIQYERENMETVLSMKLRVQDQLGFPVTCVDVKQQGKSLGNDEGIGSDVVIEVS